jgi:di/tricarboxylate transporter
MPVRPTASESKTTDRKPLADERFTGLTYDRRPAPSNATETAACPPTVDDAMTIEAWITVAVVFAVLLTLAFTRIAADLVMLAALTLLVTVDSLFPNLTIFKNLTDAFSGFANEGVITVGVLFVVAAALRETGGMALLVQKILGRPRSVTAAQARMSLPVAGLSAFMNNTPLVAMMLPVVLDWSKTLQMSASKFMMPLSFAAILGGLCTLIGTSTNVVVNGLLIRHQVELGQHGAGMGFFEITKIGVPCAIIGLLYMLIASRRLLPDRLPAVSIESDPREYTVEMTVEPGSALEGQTIEKAGLRHLVGVYLMEIERNGDVLPAVGPEEALRGNDRLVFVGVVDSIIDLQRIRGLRPATNQVFKLKSPRSRRVLIEAVVSNTCRLNGQSIREGRFRSIYNAAVIAVARNGERIQKKIGDIVLQPGDTLLLEASPNFAEQHRNSRDFYLVSKIEGSSPPRHEKALTALAILAAMVIVAAFEWLSMLNAALLAGGAMILTRCITASNARRNVDWQVLLVIGAALGIGQAMQTSGAARAIVDAIIGPLGQQPWIALAVIYLLTMVFTEVMTNNAAAALMFPIAIGTSATLGVNPMPFIISIMIAASCGFATPIGYQTNLMVYGPGGYRFTDFLRFGGLLNLLIAATTIALAPLIWPF